METEPSGPPQCRGLRAAFVASLIAMMIVLGWVVLTADLHLLGPYPAETAEERQ